MQFDELVTSTTQWATQYGMALIIALIVLAIGWIASKWLSSAILKVLPHNKAFDETIAPMVSQIVRYVVIIVAIVIALSELGVQTASILAVLGAAGLAIALALQGTLSNIAAGVMLIWLRPFNVGDYVEADGINGVVKQVGLFATQMRTVDGKFLFAPNSKIWNATIVNFNREMTRRVDFKVGIAYDADIAKAREVLLETAAADDRVLKVPEPVVYVMGLGASSVDLQLRCWTKTADYWETAMAINERGKLALDKAGVEIPFPHVHLVAPGLNANITSDSSKETK
ncbi:mechanosensitive ion channel family protein [Maritalea mediterranea]|uniref:Small-conductance mechanosensitive channel n=1 Tax=Maritalea mediterranea TaxID=2909667 RepID=A0ABS9E7N8_9HYPH|nr:mechanosensitive ion channel domain-containing protein [Maritalea mediterranea]MCF4098871.1 mechanosensitive ion channel [Maritalea mediterranea]